MLEEILDKNNNVISTRKGELINLASIIYKIKSLRGDNEGFHKLTVKKKLAYSALTSLILFTTIFSSEIYYRHCQKQQTNSYVYEKPQEKEKGMFYAAWFGGSTSMAYPNQLEIILNNKLHSLNKRTNVHIINTAVPGKSSRQILDDLNNLTYLKLDMIIYGPEWNDLWMCDLLNMRERETLKWYFEGNIGEDALISLGNWYEKHLDVFKGEFEKRKTVEYEFRKINNEVMKKLYLISAAKSIFVHSSNNPQNSIPRKDLERSDFGYISHMDDFSPAYTEGNMVSFIETARKNDIRHIVLSTTPDAFEVYEISKDFNGLCNIIFGSNDNCAYNRKQLNPMIRKLTNDYGITLLDFDRTFNRFTDKSPFFTDMMHYTPAGMNIMVDSAFKTLWPYLKDLP